MKRSIFAAAAALTLGAAAAFAQAKPAAPAHAGTTHHVRMMMQGSHYMFSPANFTIHQGDVVEFENVSGFPHNVSFEPSQIPAGAAAVLNAAMANRTGNLQGPMFTQAGQKYEVSFANAPAGQYHYFCLPHKAMGMVGVITVTAGARGGAARH